MMNIHHGNPEFPNMSTQGVNVLHSIGIKTRKELMKIAIQDEGEYFYEVITMAPNVNRAVIKEIAEEIFA